MAKYGFSFSALVDRFLAHEKDSKNPHRVTKSQVGLGKVHDWEATSEAKDGSPEKYATAAAVKAVYDYAKQGGGKAGDHAMARNNPHSVTKSQVGLSNIPNSISDSVTNDSSSILATSKAVRKTYDRASLALNTANNHGSDTENPHSVTKQQIGLGNVQNWTATSSVNDSSSSKYATAGAVKTAYDKASAALPRDGGLVGKNIEFNRDYGVEFNHFRNVASTVPKTSGCWITGGADTAGLSGLNNVALQTWYGFSVSPTSDYPSNSVKRGEIAFSVNARNGTGWFAGHLYASKNQRVFADNYHPRADKLTTGSEVTNLGYKDVPIGVSARPVGGRGVGQGVTYGATLSVNANKNRGFQLSADKPGHLFVRGIDSAGVGGFGNWLQVYTTGYKPTKADVGLSNVQNWPATSSVSDNSASRYATAAAVKKSYDLANIKLNKTANAKSASKLLTPRTIALSGDLSGSAKFDGSGNITISATVKDDSHNHTISNVDGLQAALNGKLGVSAKAADSDKVDGVDSSRIVFGNNGSAVTRITDWNKVRKSGFYEGLKAASAPESSGWFWGMKACYSSDSDYGFELIAGNSSGKIYGRITDSGGAGAWQRFYTDKFKPTKSDVGLSNVQNWPASDSTSSVARTFATSRAVKSVNDRITNFFSYINGKVKSVDDRVTSVASSIDPKIQKAIDNLENSLERMFPVGHIIINTSSANPRSYGYPGYWQLEANDCSIHATTDPKKIGRIEGENNPLVPLPEHTHRQMGAGERNGGQSGAYGSGGRFSANVEKAGVADARLDVRGRRFNVYLWRRYR